MHELSIAVALAETLSAYMREHQQRISCAHIKVGLLSGIDPEALQFAWEPAVENFPDGKLRNCRLEIKTALLHHVCRACKREFDLDSWHIVCPECGAETLHRENGSEFILESIEVENV